MKHDGTCLTSHSNVETLNLGCGIESLLKGFVNIGDWLTADNFRISPSQTASFRKISDIGPYVKDHRVSGKKVGGAKS